MISTPHNHLKLDFLKCDEALNIIFLFCFSCNQLSVFLLISPFWEDPSEWVEWLVSFESMSSNMYFAKAILQSLHLQGVPLSSSKF